MKHVLGHIYVFFTLFGYWAHGGGGDLLRDWYTTCLCSFSPWAAQKSKFSKLSLWYHDNLKWPPKVCKACFKPYLCGFHPIWVLGARGGGGIHYFDTVITQNHHPRYVKHVLGRIHVFLTLFGCWAQGRGGGGVKRDGYTTCLCSFSAYTAQKSKFSKLIFLIL